MDNLFKVDFFKNENKSPKSLALITASFICICLVFIIIYIVEIRENYKGWTSYLKLSTPILFIGLMYYASKGKGIFKKFFILSEQNISWTFSMLGGVTKHNWTDINKIDTSKSDIVFYLQSGKITKIPLSNFTYNQIKELEQKFKEVCGQKHISYIQ